MIKTILVALEASDTQSPLDLVKTGVDIFSGLVGAIAIIVGGFWAYFTFVKNRTYRPRLEVAILGEWRRLAGRSLFQATVSVKNIGASQITLLQEGTGLRVSRMAAMTSRQTVPWDDGKVFTILADHAWIEPGETVSDEILIALPVKLPEPVRCDVRLIWKWRGGKKNIDVRATRIVWPPSPRPIHKGEAPCPKTRIFSKTRTEIQQRRGKRNATGSGT